MRRAAARGWATAQRPLTFLPHLHILADGDVFAPRLLDDAGVAVKLPLPHFLQQEQLTTNIKPEELWELQQPIRDQTGASPSEGR